MEFSVFCLLLSGCNDFVRSFNDYNEADIKPNKTRRKKEREKNLNNRKAVL